ncbi:hypothetical protein [uncultured Deinococcus sp.]|uniref:hypothetical protein n=1 Tax=uncultured Deinococcus sp. TaxID=158789 RepID=UPI00258C6B8B|nr:hypothetical protein [uncultured Deinococcus sp.]
MSGAAVAKRHEGPDVLKGRKRPPDRGSLRELLDQSHDALVPLALGSAALSHSPTLELPSDRERPHVRVADAPLVEGAVLAAVAATGGDLDSVANVAATGQNMSKVP